MLRSLDRRGADAFDPDDIVDPRLQQRATRGRWSKPGLPEAVAAVEQLLQHDATLSLLAACKQIARIMTNYWRSALTDIYRDDAGGIIGGRPRQTNQWQQLSPETLAAQLRAAVYATRRKS